MVAWAETMHVSQTVVRASRRTNAQGTYLGLARAHYSMVRYYVRMTTLCPVPKPSTCGTA